MINKRAKIKITQTTIDNTEALTTESTQSGALIGSNDDLLTEILRRLPAAYVLRFKSVSKHWQSLLSHRRFTLPYDNVPVSPGLFVRNMYIPFDVETQTPPPFRSLNFYRDRCGIKVVQSCNGLLLCCSNRGSERTRKYYVFNPTTKQFAVIPPVIKCSDANNAIRFMGLAFHQTDCVRYKVVCFHKANRNKNVFRIQIYSSETGKWRISQESYFGSDFTSSNGVYCNGAIHWIPDRPYLLYFSLDVEQVHTMLLPERPSSCQRISGNPGVICMRSCCRRGRPLYFGESRGHLHLVEAARHESPLHVNVYEMLADYSGWLMKYRVELDELRTAYPDMVYSNRDLSNYLFEIFDVVRGEEEETTFLVVRIPEKIMRYNVATKSFEKIIDMPTRLCYQRICYTNVHRYTQTLSYF